MAEEKDISAVAEPYSLTGCADDDSIEELRRKNTKRADWILTPMLCLLYMTAFLDRTNIANAKIVGMIPDLKLGNTGYNTALWVFYLPFVLLEIPSNLVLSAKSRSGRRIAPSHWIGFISFGLGICSMCQGLVKTGGQLYVCRFFMGVFEAGIAPGAAYLMSQYYPRHIFPLKYTLFFVSALVGNSFSGFLAYAIENLDGTDGYEGWRWIFIIEGIWSIALSIAIMLIFPGKSFIEFQDKLVIDDPHEILTWKTLVAGIRDTFKNKFTWLMTLAYFCADNGVSSTVAFQPTILTQLGWTARQAQLHSMPVYLCSIVICLACSRLSGMIKLRSPFIIAGFCLAIIGWAIQYVLVPSAAVRYFGIFCIPIGSYITMPLLVAWNNDNLHSSTQRSVGTALQLALGNSANFVSSNVFITKQAPKYPVGYGVGLALAVTGAATILVLVLLLRAENQKIKAAEEAGLSEGQETQQHTL